MSLLGAVALFCDSRGSASPNYMKIFTMSLDDVILWLFHELEEMAVSQWDACQFSWRATKMRLSPVALLASL